MFLGHYESGYSYAYGYDQANQYYDPIHDHYNDEHHSNDNNDDEEEDLKMTDHDDDDDDGGEITTIDLENLRIPVRTHDFLDYYNTANLSSAINDSLSIDSLTEHFADFDPTSMQVGRLRIISKITICKPLLKNLFIFKSLKQNPLTSKLFIEGFIYLVICLSCVLGNILVVLSVFTYRPLQSVQNIFIVSLAMADALVAVFVMPFHIIYHITDGKWLFGTLVCHFFLLLDILLCTASTLHLCCIALDRYWAIKDSIRYAQKRTMKRVLLMIFFAWLSSLVKKTTLYCFSLYALCLFPIFPF